jgi:hypothetical protein
MKVSLSLTSQGLIRALRGRMHDLAEAAELRRRPAAHAPRKAKRAKPSGRTEGRDRHDSAGG